jgi:predicted transport protein
VRVILVWPDVVAALGLWVPPVAVAFWYPVWDRLVYWHHRTNLTGFWSELAVNWPTRRQRLHDYVAGAVAKPTVHLSADPGKGESPTAYKTVTEYLGDADESLANLYSDLEARLLSLGDDTQKKVTQSYIAFKRLKNFACVEVKAASQKLMVYLKVDPDSIDLIDGFTRDVSEIGHFGTGNLEVTIQNVADLDRAQTLFEMSYDLA